MSSNTEIKELSFEEMSEISGCGDGFWKKLGKKFGLIGAAAKAGSLAVDGYRYNVQNSMEGKNSMLRCHGW